MHYKAMVIKIVWYWHEDRHYRSMEKNWQSRSRPTHLWVIDFQQGVVAVQWGKNSLQQLVLRPLDIHAQKNEAGPLLHTTYKKLVQNVSKI